MKAGGILDGAVVALAVLAAATCCLGPLLLASGLLVGLGTISAYGTRIAVPAIAALVFCGAAATWLVWRTRRRCSPAARSAWPVQRHPLDP
ncbi:hypothetical protein EPN44_01280 [bacterium]|nr:MAG: hypothetical protein EPN44_01280 [bacterium]